MTVQLNIYLPTYFDHEVYEYPGCELLINSICHNSPLKITMRGVAGYIVAVMMFSGGVIKVETKWETKGETKWETKGETKWETKVETKTVTLEYEVNSLDEMIKPLRDVINGK